MMNLVNATFLDLILTGTGVQPQIPDPANLKYNDPGFDPEIHLMIGQRAYNVDDNIVYMRTKTGIEKTGFLSDAERARIMTNAERLKLSGIDEGANNYTHPETHSLAIITETTDKKVMTADERTKLAGLPSSIPSAPVTSVNGQTGDVIISFNQGYVTKVNYSSSGGTLPNATVSAGDDYNKILVEILDPSYGEYIFQYTFYYGTWDWKTHEVDVVLYYGIMPTEAEALSKIWLNGDSSSDWGENAAHDDHTLTLPVPIGHLGSFKLRLRKAHTSTEPSDTSYKLVRVHNSDAYYIEVLDIKQGFFVPETP